jgi:hypothetical protein
MNLLMFLHDAYGGHGGISRNNRDVLDALVHDSRVERIVALPRIAGDGSDPVPAKVDWRAAAAGGIRAYLAESLRAIAGARTDLPISACCPQPTWRSSQPARRSGFSSTASMPGTSRRTRC